MNTAVLVAAGSAALAAGLALPHRVRLPDPRPAATAAQSGGWMRRYRVLWSVLAAAGAVVFVSGNAGPVAGVVAAVVTWVAIGRSEPPGERRRREAVRRDVPHVVELFAATLRAGSAPGDGIALVCAALPGPAADRLDGIAARLSLGLDPAQVWRSLADDAELGRLGRTLARSQVTGAPVVASVERLADDLSRASRAATEERARAVGVKAALPLGLCLLPAFVLIGIVPLVVALLTSLDL